MTEHINLKEFCENGGDVMLKTDAEDYLRNQSKKRVAGETLQKGEKNALQELYERVEKESYQASINNSETNYENAVQDELNWLLSHKDIADAVEDLKNGEKHAKNALYGFVRSRRIDESMYRELIKRYYKSNAHKKTRYKANVRKKRKERTWTYNGIPLSKSTLLRALLWTSIIVAIFISANSITVVKDNFITSTAFGYTTFMAFLYYYAYRENERENEELKNKIKRLENESAKAQNNSPQE